MSRDGERKYVKLAFYYYGTLSGRKNMLKETKFNPWGRLWYTLQTTVTFNPGPAPN